MVKSGGSQIEIIPSKGGIIREIFLILRGNSKKLNKIP